MFNSGVFLIRLQAMFAQRLEGMYSPTHGILGSRFTGKDGVSDTMVMICMTA
jgi:hypothetical protein